MKIYDLEWIGGTGYVPNLGDSVDVETSDETEVKRRVESGGWQVRKVYESEETTNQENTNGLTVTTTETEIKTTEDSETPDFIPELSNPSKKSKHQREN